jgi:hypothetical protein
VARALLLTALLASASACAVEPVPLPAVPLPAPGDDPGGDTDAGADLGTRRLVLQAVRSVDRRVGAAHQLFDQTLGVPCAPVGALNSTTALLCRPHLLPSVPVTYLDERCAVPLALSDAPDGTLVTAVGDFDLGSMARLRGAVRPAPTQRWTRDSGRACVPDTSPATAPVRPLDVLDDLTFGRLRPARETRAELYVDRLSTEDGLEVVVGLVDRTSGARCEPGLTDAGPRCVPEQQTITEPLLLDATCTRPILLQYGGVTVGRLPETGEYMRFEQQGVPFTTDVGRLVDGRCVRERRDFGRRTYHVGTPYPPEAWPKVTFADETSGELTHRVALSVDGARLTPSIFVPVSWGQAGGFGRSDSLWSGDVRCSPVSVDGELRCVPGPLGDRAMFADARCTVRAALGVPEGLRSVHVQLDDGDAASAWIPRGRAFEVAARGMGWIYAELWSGECVQDREVERAVLGPPARSDEAPRLVVTYE